MTDTTCQQNRIQRLLTHRVWAPSMIVLTMLTCVPAVFTGFFNDDYLQRAELIAPSTCHDALAQVGLDVNEPGHLTTCLAKVFIAVGPNKNKQALLEYGAMPWWTGPNYNVSLFRPLATLTHWLDSHWLGDSLVWMHTHNILWLGLVIFMAMVVYRALMPSHPVVIGLALLCLALDSNHYFPTLWIANRNQLMALFFALSSVYMHHLWRIKHCPYAAILSIVGLSAALLSAEGGVATFAFLFAYALCLDQNAWFKRAATLIPSVTIILMWRWAYSHFGYGAQGGGFYFDPAGQPVLFAQAAIQRAAFLLAGQWLAIPPDLFAFIHDTMRWPVTLGLWALVLISVVTCLPLLLKDRTARFWCVAMGAAIVPVCAAVPMGRNLLFASIAGFALMCQFIFGVLTGQSWLPKSRLAVKMLRVCAWCLVLIHVGFGFIATAAMPKVTHDMMAQMTDTYDLSKTQDDANKDLIIINAPNPASMIYMPYKQALLQAPLPQHLHMLTPGYGPLEITRPTDSSLRIKALEASLLTCRPTSRLEIVHLYRYLSDFRASQDTIQPGQAIQCPGLTVTVEAIDAQRQPVEILCEFDTPLEAASRTWLRWDWQLEQYESFTLPQIGESFQLKGPF